MVNVDKYGEHYAFDKIHGGAGARREIHTGYFDLTKTYKAVKDVLHHKSGYHVHEVDYEISRNGEKRGLVAKFHAECVYGEYILSSMHFILEISQDLAKTKEFEIDGKMKKLGYGKARLHMAGVHMEVDFQNKRNKGPLLNMLWRIYWHFFGQKLMKRYDLVAGSDRNMVRQAFRKNMYL